MIVLFTKRAQNHYNNLLTYLDAQFGERTANEFTRHLSDFIKLLALFPKIGRIEMAQKSIYGFQLTQQTRIIYRVKGTQVIILALFDVRKNPRKKVAFFR